MTKKPKKKKQNDLSKKAKMADVEQNELDQDDSSLCKST